MGSLNITLDQGVVSWREYDKEGVRPDQYKLIHIDDVSAFESEVTEMAPDPDHEMSYKYHFHLKSGKTITFSVSGPIRSYENMCTQIHRAVFGLGAESKPELRPVK